MIELIRDHIIPASMSLFPASFNSAGARAMLLAIGLQESKFIYRSQNMGPALGLWQFEVNGIRGVRTHTKTENYYISILKRLNYKPTLTDVAVQIAVGHNDILACCIARLLLLTIPRRFAPAGNYDESWNQYVSTWRPGKPRRDEWDKNFSVAWSLVDDSKIS